MFEDAVEKLTSQAGEVIDFVTSFGAEGVGAAVVGEKNRCWKAAMTSVGEPVTWRERGAEVEERETKACRRRGTSQVDRDGNGIKGAEPQGGDMALIA